MHRRDSLGQATRGGIRVVRQRMIVAAALAAAALVIPVSNSVGAAPGAGTVQQAPDFGPNVVIFDPSMPTSEIQDTFDEIWEQQRDAEMGSGRYSLLFKPGDLRVDRRATAGQGRLLHRGRRVGRVAG